MLLLLGAHSVKMNTHLYPASFDHFIKLRLRYFFKFLSLFFSNALNMNSLERIIPPQKQEDQLMINVTNINLFLRQQNTS